MLDANELITSAIFTSISFAVHVPTDNTRSYMIGRERKLLVLEFLLMTFKVIPP